MRQKPRAEFMKLCCGRVFVALLILVGFVPHAQSAGIDPTFGDFGKLSEATFGGSGIPNDFTAFSILDDGAGNKLTLGLSATPRFFNPPLVNDGAGTFSTVAGLNLGGPGDPATTLGTTWNFSWFVKAEGAKDISEYDVKLLYDFDSNADNEAPSLGVFDLVALIAFFSASDELNQGSQNLAFGFLSGIPTFPFISPPAGSFDPFAAGEYTFALLSNFVDDKDDQKSFVSINVNVTPVPLPAALPLLGFALGIFGLFGWRRKRSATA